MTKAKTTKTDEHTVPEQIAPVEIPAGGDLEPANIDQQVKDMTWDGGQLEGTDEPKALAALAASEEMLAIKDAKGVCSYIRALAVEFPLMPKADFVAVLVPLGLNKATVGIQRAKALKGD